MGSLFPETPAARHSDRAFELAYYSVDWRIIEQEKDVGLED